ncbi:hypothetical protein CTAYLR_002045 [Chrysophaeum taylorii]|uniref:Methenyltetrahydrofolate cyclohydrolase n=1 Tax=Chrysophaeum taylorii TaxID=2483200 RepID=A0AAD7UP65_9STRA|nr:hypothetical protein CTAYLR_002045 [Chrysophaeum taylorii]
MTTTATPTTQSVAVAAAAAAALCAVAYATKRPKKERDAEIIDGKAIAKAVRLEVASGVAELVKRNGVRPGLAVVLVGDRKDSQTYVRNKKKAAEEVGFYSVDVNLDANASENEIVASVRALNANPNVHAILVQLPLPDHVDEARVLKAIDHTKDADGFSAANVGKMWTRGGEPPLALPCTPAGCVELLKRSGATISGAQAVVVGRSNIVGTPCAALLQALDATVTVCHSRTRDVAALVRAADIVVVAVGKPHYVKAEWLKPGAVVIDVGINAVDDASRPRGYRLVGDVDFEKARRVASKITPVPGGVGPMTIAMLMRNTLNLAKYHVQTTCAAEDDVASSAASRPVVVEAGGEEARAVAITPPPLVVETKKNPLLLLGEKRMMCRKIERREPVPPDIEISQAVEPLAIEAVARAAGLDDDEFLVYGKHKAKVDAAKVHSRLRRGEEGSKGALVVVCGVTPTPLGEGKSTTTIGVSQALGANLGKRVVTTIRQPSQGPVMGIKGGAAGGGYSQVIPMDEFNLHMTGDIHAVVAANNLVAAALDARMFHEKTQSDEALFNRLCPVVGKEGIRPLPAPLQNRLRKLGVTAPEKLADAAKLDPNERVALARLDVDPESIHWKRVVDTCDRFLRKIEVGRNATEKGMTRETGFDIAVASEIMAVLALARDAADLRKRLGAMTVGTSRRGGGLVTCDDLGVAGALAVLLKDALMPTLMQTLEGTPVLVHCGPFANIAHGNSSVIADHLALRLVGEGGFVVTEAGFGADIGGEKNFDIKARAGDLAPSCAVIVATVRALKAHAAEPRPNETDLERLARGCANVEHHVRCVAHKFGLRCVVALNKFASDTDDEIALVCTKCLDAGAFAAVPADHFARGGDGAVALARAVVDACDSPPSTFRYLYPLDRSIREKISTVVHEIYLGAEVEYSEHARALLDAYETNDDVRKLPVCVAKTQYSLSTDPKAKGAPSGHSFFVRDLRPSLGAGFIVVVAGDIMTIPGLPTRPNYFDIDFDPDTGRVIGLS